MRSAPRTAAVALGLALLVGCTPTEPVETPTASPTIPPPDTLGPEADLPGCEDIIPASLVNTFTGVRWTPELEDWVLGGQPVDGALFCIWSDQEDADSEQARFGYAEPSADQLDAARAELEGEGWSFEATAGGEYATSASADGVYLFHEDGSVRFDDSRESVDLMTAPS